MEYDITTVEKAKETLESIRKIWPNTKLEEIDYSDFDFVLEHITSNMDECKDIKLHGLKTLKELIEENNSIIDFCIKGSTKSQEEIKKCIEHCKKYDNKISTFFSYEDGKFQYKDNLTKGPEIFNPSKLSLSCAARQEWEKRSKAFKITIIAKYNEINFLTGGEKTVNEKLAENLEYKSKNKKINEFTAELKNGIEPNRLTIEEIK